MNSNILGLLVSKFSSLNTHTFQISQFIIIFPANLYNIPYGRCSGLIGTFDGKMLEHENEKQSLLCCIQCICQNLKMLTKLKLSSLILQTETVPVLFLMPLIPGLQWDPLFSCLQTYISLLFFEPMVVGLHWRGESVVFLCRLKKGLNLR